MRNATRWHELLVGLARVETLDVRRSKDRATVAIEQPTTSRSAQRAALGPQ